MIDVKDELLIALLDCGYMDIKTMTDIMDMGNELFDNNIISDVITDHSGDNISFNSILGDAMVEITYRLADELDVNDTDNIDYRGILDEYWACPYTNYMDSHFQIECLDGWGPGFSKESLLNNLSSELLNLKNRDE
jgi:hypothetical protein